ncbi:hypothetical protein K1T71_007560 [Dendrolimus kikuchii]|uniref:Uncharacterized protein n=1 Tax=Dendrolimus kikuchii TaxID=765133 RepID=A0ACC1CXR4_9NEOP|nr:hypothetical protein K1T71_007560 [Dendrolimus kikuchii]
MNDPWDVKSVRQSGQYVSCMKINGVPLLPPVLSKECRKEMQYYKLLAKEVEKRIAQLQPYYIDSDTESSDKTDAPELPDSEQNDETPIEEIQAGFNINNLINVNKIDDIDSPINDSVHKIQSPVTKFIEKEKLDTTVINPSKLVTDQTVDTLKIVTPPIDVPERDYDSPKKQKELITEYETVSKVHYDIELSSFQPKKELSDQLYDADLPLHQDGPSSISSKSFTGSLIDIYSESMKDCQLQPLTRQSSYTLLKPSPQLLAHLEVQSQSTGVEMSCISMSESLSNLTSPGKKRRSWDLESAKVKWSSMAMELKQQKIPNVTNRNASRVHVNTPINKKHQINQPRARSVTVDRTKKTYSPKMMPKSDPIQKPYKAASPIRNCNTNHAAPRSLSPKNVNKDQSPKQTTLISESEDPATKVRELYEKIQKQQLLQMASLVEKQKREQMLLQQVFEEQNNLLYKQLKTICPKSPVESNEAWVDRCQEVERGPVSLSQLINHSVDQSTCDTSSSTLTDTNNYINHCDNVLKKSRDITGSLKKQTTNKSRSMNGSKIESRLQSNQDGSRTRTHSPIRKNPTSRRLNYDTSATSDPEYEPILTDRTNDTMADLNVSFPTDQSDGSYHSVILNLSKELTVMKTNPLPATVPSRSTDSAINNMEKSIQNSINTMRSQVVRAQPSPRECAAATKLVAYAKGYLVRRLMRTERVQATVQTIKDALLCALELHQDREGIRGADVDLHRRLIQQITAACYSLHDTFVASTPAERCAMIAADRGRRRSIAARLPTKTFRQTDTMSQSYSGSLPARNKRTSATSLMTQSNYETFSGDKSVAVSRTRYVPSPRRRPWR